MRIRIVDYVGNPGGGIRFAIELIRAIIQEHPNTDFEICSYGTALQRYREQLGDISQHVNFISIKPHRHWQTQIARLIGGLPFFNELVRWFTWSYDVPPEALTSCDAVWFPWIHSHRLPVVHNVPLIGSLHDIILVQFAHLLKGYLPVALVRDERQAIAGWLASPARIVVSSKATIEALQEAFNIDAGRVEVVSVLGDHAISNATPHETLSWDWSQRPFLLCPANIMPHKNHERLLLGVAKWGGPHPLVLTGARTDLTWPNRRGLRLRRLAKRLNLYADNKLVPLGYITNAMYYALLDAAWAVVMPTLAEGGGSFPVLEAMSRGVPVVCADIPVMREQMAFTGGEVLWFNPEQPEELAARLKELAEKYDCYKELAVNQSHKLQHRTWAQVASDYWNIIVQATRRPADIIH